MSSIPAPTSASADTETDHLWLDRAAALAIHGHGHVSPNPLVGCIVLDAGGQLVGSGFHRRCGGGHAEVEALAMAGDRARGGTALVTLEPCTHHGRTGPCVVALEDAGVSRVVMGTRDPHAEAAGGLEALVARGITAEHLPNEACIELLAPFAWRIRTGLPWLTGKWAQSLDGWLAPREGTGWISSPASRRLVHRERARSDAVITGIGTVLADDPLLTPRHVRLRRMPVRIVIDTTLRTPIDSALVRSVDAGPVVIACGDQADESLEQALTSRGVQVRPFRVTAGRLCLTDVLVDLAAQYDITWAMTEAGPGLLRGLLDEDLVRELAVFVAPEPLEHGTAPAPVNILDSQMPRAVLRRVHQREQDMLLRYGVEPTTA